MKDARELEEGGRFPQALDAYRSCAGQGPAADGRYCAARVAVLEAQAADGFAGWSVLAAVRRDYRTLGPEAARRRVESELAARPGGPAAAELERWLGEQGRGGVDRGRVQRQRGVAGVLALIGVGYAGVAARGLRGRELGRAKEAGTGRRWLLSLAVGWVLLAAVPAAMAWAWGASDWPWFAGTGSCAIVGVALAPRAPPWLAASGTFALVGLCTFAAGWFDALGVG